MSNSPNPYRTADSQSEKFMTKARANPMVPLGIAAMVGMVGWGAYNYRNRGDMKTSVYLMHLRVRAQSMVVGALTLGIGYQLIKQYVWNKEEHEQQVKEYYAKLHQRR